MSDLQCPENDDVSLTRHRSPNLKNGILISTHYDVLLRISTHYHYREASQQAPDAQHDAYVQTSTIRRQLRQSKARKVIASKLVKEVSNFFGIISCHSNAPQPMLLLPPPRRWWVISESRCSSARAHILQRMPRQRPWSG